MDCKNCKAANIHICLSAPSFLCICSPLPPPPATLTLDRCVCAVIMIYLCLFKNRPRNDVNTEYCVLSVVGRVCEPYVRCVSITSGTLHAPLSQRCRFICVLLTREAVTYLPCITIQIQMFCKQRAVHFLYKCRIYHIPYIYIPYTVYGIPPACLVPSYKIIIIRIQRMFGDERVH